MDQVIALVSNYAKPRYEDEFVDRLNFQYTSYIFGFSALVIGYNTYFGTAIRCWTPAEFRDGWSEYARDYCLIENTYYLPLEDPNLPPAEQREQKELTYYQWVQFILVFLAFLFYLPYMFWKTVNWWSGLQVRSVVKASVELDKISLKNREPQMQKIANHLYQFVHNGHRKSPIPLVPNIIGRNWVAFTYILTKLFFVINLIAQLILIHILLGFNWGDFFSFRIGFGSNWINNGIFPRQTMCDFDIRNKGSIQQYSIQCVLPMNMLNEKIFLILFYWLIVLLFITLYNLSRSISSFFLFTSRQEFTQRMLHAGFYDHSHSKDVSTSSTEKVPLIERPDSFNNDHNRFLSLTPDLVVILNLIAKNAGDNVCSDILSLLFKKYSEKSQ